MPKIKGVEPETSGMGRALRAVVGGMLRLLPASAPMWFYKTLLRPRPLRAAAHAVLRKIIPASITLPEGELVLNPDDPIVSGALALGTYEPGSIALWRSLLREDMNVLDVGANLGLYTLIAAGRAKRGRVLSFEPSTENASVLRAMLDRNRFTHVSVVQAAVGSAPGSGTLSLDPDNKGLHSLLPLKGASGSESVEVKRIDDVVKQHGISPVHLIKIDIEGWEAQALRGMAGVLAADHPVILLEFMPQWIEDAGDDPRRLLGDLRALGYSLSVVDENDGRRQPVSDDDAFMRRFVARDDYVNLLAVPAV